MFLFLILPRPIINMHRRLYISEILTAIFDSIQKSNQISALYRLARFCKTFQCEPTLDLLWGDLRHDLKTILKYFPRDLLTSNPSGAMLTVYSKAFGLTWGRISRDGFQTTGRICRCILLSLLHTFSFPLEIHRSFRIAYIYLRGRNQLSSLAIRLSAS